MNRASGFLFPSAAVKLSDDDAAARSKAGKESDQQVNQRTGRAADRAERLLTDEVSDDNRVNGVVKLLKEGSEQDREEEFKQLLPDDAIDNTASGRDFLFCLFHI